MEYTLFIYEIDEDPRNMTVNFPGKPNYGELTEAMKDLFGEEALESVHVIHGGEVREMFFISDGKNMGLPTNAKATDIYHDDLKRRGISKEDAGVILGTAVIVARKM